MRFKKFYIHFEFKNAPKKERVSKKFLVTYPKWSGIAKEPTWPSFCLSRPWLSSSYYHTFYDQLLPPRQPDFLLR